MLLRKFNFESEHGDWEEVEDAVFAIPVKANPGAYEKFHRWSIVFKFERKL